jgi:hypothetical protein
MHQQEKNHHHHHHHHHHHPTHLGLGQVVYVRDDMESVLVGRPVDPNHVFWYAFVLPRIDRLSKVCIQVFVENDVAVDLEG